MADRPGRSHTLHLEYVFDRLLATKLEQVYAVLVADNARRVGASTGLRGAIHEDSCDLCPSLLGPTERGEDDCQSDHGIDGVCQSEGYSVPAEWIFEDEGTAGRASCARDWSACVTSPPKARFKRCWSCLRPAEPQVCVSSSAHRRVGSARRAGVVYQGAAIRLTGRSTALGFQGMMAEYERAQILERSRRGKLHRARQGEISVLGGAPYGFVMFTRVMSGRAITK